MIVLDANLLIYAYDRSAAAHKTAKEWFEAALSGDDPMGIPLQSITAFLRLMTESKFQRAPMTVEDAIATAASWLELPHVRLLTPSDRHWNLLSQVLIRNGVSGRLISDAQIVTTALEFGGTVASVDRDFGRFSEVVTINPLQPER